MKRILDRVVDIIGEHASVIIAVIIFVCLASLCAHGADVADCKRACDGAPAKLVDGVGCLCNTAHETWTWRALP